MADNWNIPDRISLQSCVNYQPVNNIDASGKKWPSVVWQTWSGKNPQNAFPTRKGGPWNTRYKNLVIIQSHCTPYSVNGIDYSTIEAGDTIDDSPFNSIVDSVNNELSRRGISEPKYVSYVQSRENAYANSLADIYNAIDQISANILSSDNAPDTNDVIRAAQVIATTDVLSTLIHECVCYTDCADYSVCYCYGYCNYY